MRTPAGSEPEDLNLLGSKRVGTVDPWGNGRRGHGVLESHHSKTPTLHFRRTEVVSCCGLKSALRQSRRR